MKVQKLEAQPYAALQAVMACGDPAKTLEAFKPLSEFCSVTQEIQTAENTLKANIAQLGKMAYAFLASDLSKTAAYAGMGDTKALAAFLRIPDKRNGLNRIMPIRNAFRVVEAGLLAESLFDDTKADTLIALGEVVKLVSFQLDHPAIADAIAVLHKTGDKESKAKQIRGIKPRVKLAENGAVEGYLSAEDAIAEAEKAKAEPTHANTLDAHAAASMLVTGHLDVFLAALVATAKDTDSLEIGTKIIRACAEAGYHLSAKFGNAKVNTVFSETVAATDAAEKSAKAGKDAGLASGVKLVTATV